MKKIFALAFNDVRNISRDSIQLFFLLIPFVAVIAIKVILPYIDELVPQYVPGLQFDITEHYMFIASFIIQIAPLLLGVVIGFLVVDERDENILLVISVSPLSKSGYLAMRIMIPAILSIGYTYAILAIFGYNTWNPVWVFPIALMSGLAAPFGALFMPAFAKNKVEGLALFKLFSGIIVASFIAYIIPDPWCFFAGILPNFWITKAFLYHLTPGWEYGLLLLGGFVMHIIWISALLWLFKQKVG